MPLSARKLPAISAEISIEKDGEVFYMLSNSSRQLLIVAIWQIRSTYLHICPYGCSGIIRIGEVEMNVVKGRFGLKDGDRRFAKVGYVGSRSFLVKSDCVGS